MSQRRVSPAFALLLLLPAASLAEEAAPYDLNAVVRTALANHPSLRGAAAQLNAFAAQAQQAKSGYSLKVEATLGLTRLQNDPSFSVPPLGTLVFGKADNKQASVTAQYPLTTGGKLEGLNRQAQAGIAASQEALARQRQQVALDVTTAYFSVLKASQMVEVARDQLKALQAQRDAIAKMLEQGVVTRIDLLRAETGVSGAQEFETKARNGEAVATAALANAMGSAADSALNVAAGDAQASPAADLPGETAAAIEEALRQRPELRQVEAQHSAAAAGVDVARSGKRPTAGLFAQYDAGRPTFMPETGNWSAGVMLKLNVFDGGATSADVTRAEAQAAQVQAGLDELRNGIRLQVTQAFLNVSSAKERVKTTEQAVATAEEGVRLVRVGYENGVTTITDFLAAQAELTKARTDHVTALFDVQIAQSELRFALGRQPDQG